MSADLSSFLKTLEENRLLRRISAEVDPEYEVTEIIHRLYREYPVDATPALLFERLKGSKFPLAINLLSSPRAIELAVGQEPEALGRRLAEAVHELQNAAPKGQVLSWAWKHRDLLSRARASRPRRDSSAPCKQVKTTGADVNLLEFPILKCWPEDGGRFITAGLVITKSPKTGARNMGIYRLQVHSRNELGLHWQIQKGGGFHFWEAEQLNEPLEVAIALGPHPLLWLAGVLPLPEGVDEIAFAGFASGKSVPLVRCETVDLEVPASAEIVIEGIARPGRRRMEGPFGDHFGHYSHAAEFPVLEVGCVTHREGAIYHAAVVGKPPQEDKAMGEAVTELFNPIVQLTKPEVTDLWAYYEAGFHNLLVASVKQRYEKESVKAALSLLGEGQLSLTKCLFLVDPGVPVRDFAAVMRALAKNFDPAEDFILLPSTSQDTLDFTGAKMNRGSKMILDATSRPGRADKADDPARWPQVRIEDTAILQTRVIENALWVAQVRGEGRPLLAKLAQNESLRRFKMLALVSEDVPLDNDVLLLWGIFTRFDCERDILFGGARLDGARPVYSGPLAIDATWKRGYPRPVEMLQDVADTVARRWKEYRI